MNKNITKLLLSATLLLCCFAAIAAGTQPSAGDGSQANPYLLTNYADLQWFAAQVNGGQNGICAKLTADITAGGTWTPIGNSSQCYRGDFDGNGHTISGLSLSDNETSNVGLFGKATDDAHIHHVGVVGCSFSGKDHVGAICGDFANGVIEYCYSTGTIYALTGDGGGLTGSCYTNAHIRQCHTSCAVTAGAGNYGGITGYLWGDVNHCCVMEGKNAEGHVFYGGKTDDAVFADNTAHSEAAFASGEVCWLLNNGVTDGSQKWYQTLGGTDNLPVLDNSHGTVYYGYDGNVLTYSNSPLTPPTIDNVAYIDADGVEQTADNVSIIMNASEQVTWSAGWYVVQGADITLAKGAVCSGEVHLILADGAKLTATGDNNSSTPGIQVSGDGNSLAIYGQSAQSGELIANGGNDGAGIGGKRFTSGSNITINGGVVTATGGIAAAGIGGGNDGAGLYITINGGIVTATGGEMGAGIGGGWASTVYYSGNYITITGGEVTATGGGMGAGIGGGFGGSCSNISIIGGKVTATGGMGVSGIGAGKNGTNSYSVKIATTLLVKADNNNPPTTVIPNTGFNLADSLKGKQYVTTEPIIITYGEHITVSPEFASGDNVAYGTYTFTAADRWADNYEFIGFYKESTFDTPITEGVSGRTCTLTVTETPISVYAKYEEFIPIPYIDADGQEQTIKDTEVTEITNSSSTLNAGWYVVTGEVSTGTLTCNGAVHLILADGAKLTAQGETDQAGITVSGEGNSLTIYGQIAQSGQLIANGGKHAAGIGGGSGGSGTNITINGGTVTASGGDYGAGIGGGENAPGSNITINGGTVTANSYNLGAGIGGGYDGSGSHITINGGTVTATGKNGAAGIGGGYRDVNPSGESDGSGSYITINGGVVTATGNFGGAGIGGGNYCFGSYITINGGTVNANGGYDGFGGAGIGGGCKSSGSNITINGGTITANGGQYGAGVGGGYNGSGSDIFVVPELIVRAGNDNPPVTVIAPEHTAETDIAGDLAGKRYATVRIPQGGIVTYGENITVSPQFASGSRVAAETVVTFTAADRFAYNYEFIGFYKESTFDTPITAGVSGRTYTVMVLDDDISVYAKYEEFIPTPYIDANGQEQSVKTTEITSETSTSLSAGWYVVTGEVSRGNITCNGAVHLILADGAKLTATGGENQAGITVSGNGKSLTIYGQTAQSGQLIAQGGKHGAGIGGGYASGSNITINGGEITATGGDCGAGIGGGDRGAGYNIIINRGVVTATGGNMASGIGGGFEQSGYDITINGGEVTANGGEDGAGIGGGIRKDGYNITINGGEVTANGGEDGAGIGGGMNGSCSNIFVAAALTVYADNNNPPTTIIMHATGQDIASSVNKRHVIVKDDMTDVKNAAINAINAAIEGVTNEDIIAIATNAIAAINAAINVREITIIKEQALAAIAALKSAYNSALGEMGVPCEDCPAVDVTKGTTTIRLYSPEKVEFRKME